LCAIIALLRSFVLAGRATGGESVAAIITPAAAVSVEIAFSESWVIIVIVVLHSNSFMSPVSTTYSRGTVVPIRILMREGVVRIGTLHRRRRLGIVRVGRQMSTWHLFIAAAVVVTSRQRSVLAEIFL
jgi:hypothetical protein